MKYPNIPGIIQSNIRFVDSCWGLDGGEELFCMKKVEIPTNIGNKYGKGLSVVILPKLSPKKLSSIGIA